MKNIFSILILLIFSQSLFGFTPIPVDEYYQSVIFLTGDSLKAALHDLIKDHVMYPYFSDSTVATKDIMIEADADISHPGNIILFYSGRSQKAEYADHGDNFDYIKEYGISHDDSWNREHIWAKSHGFPDMADTAYTDVHHLRPADRSVNGARGNRDFDWGGFELGEVEGCYYDFDSWEPPDRVKGDVARMMFYMATRYEGENKTYDLELLDKTGTYGPKFGKLSTLLQWHMLDPVDARERHRNEVIYSYQRNRNPFIDHPEFVEKIWGDPVIEPVLNYSDPVIGFGNQVIEQFSLPQQFVINGYNLSGEVNLNVSSPFFIAETIDGIPRTELLFHPLEDPLNQRIFIYFKPDMKTVYEDALSITSDGAESQNVILTGHGIDPLARIIISSSFENGWEGWTAYSVSGNENWYPSSYGDRHFMKMSGYKADEPCVDWLISPELDLRSYQDVILSFETAKNHTDITSGFEVFISIDYIEGNDPQNYNWHPLPAFLSEGYYEWKHSGYIDISEFATSDVHIAFKYINSSPSKATSWEVDDVEVIGVEKK